LGLGPIHLTSLQAQPVLTVTPANASVAAASGRASFTVTNSGSGRISYSASISAGSDWLSITAGASGASGGTIRVYFTQNNGIPRTGQITVTASGAGGSPTTITVTQAGVGGAASPTQTPSGSEGGGRLEIGNPNPWPNPSATPFDFSGALPPGWVSRGHSLQITSQAGDSVGQGRTFSIPSTTGYSMRNYRSGQTITISVSHGSNENWDLVFDAPGDSVLGEGTYSGATKYPSNSASEPGLSVSGNGRSSSTVTGSFVVKEIDVSGSGVRFWATFEQRSDGSEAALVGEVRYNAILPTPTPTPVAGPVLSVTPGSSSVAAASGRANLSVSNTGRGTLSYSASVSAGSDWLSITSGASGGNSGTIRIFFAQNNGIQRTGQITVMANGAGGSPTVVTITQAARPGAPTPTPTPSATPSPAPTVTPTPTPSATPAAGPVLAVSPVNATWPVSGGRANFTVRNAGRGTLSYSASVSVGSNWLSITAGASGGNSGTIRVLSAANSGVPRTGQITVTANGAGGSPTTISVFQDGPVPYVPPGSGGGGAGSSGGSLSFGASTLSFGTGGLVPGDFPYNPSFPVGTVTLSGIQGGTIANWGTLPPTGVTLFGGSPAPTPTPTPSPTPVP